MRDGFASLITGSEMDESKIPGGGLDHHRRGGQLQLAMIVRGQEKIIKRELEEMDSLQSPLYQT